MGVLTDFFVASREELREAFPTWLEVADAPEIREVENRFTGQKQQVRHWPPKTRPAKRVSDQEAVPEYRHLPHGEYKGIDHVKVVILHEQLSGAPFDACLESLERPALIDPRESDETGVHPLDADFVARLSGLTEEDVGTTAARWAQTEEMQLDGISVEECETIVRELAQDARATNRDMYYCWSL